MDRTLVALGASILTACASSPKSTSDEPPPPQSGPLRPDQILTILQRSAIMYDLDSETVVRATDIGSVVEEVELPRRPVDPYFEVVRGDDGQRQLKTSRPPSAVAPLFREADLAFAAKEFDAALALYGEAVSRAPGYFKGHTFLGNTQFFLGEYDKAEQSFLRALELNPLDYQAYMFLGQTYVEQGRSQLAKRALIHAFMLNRANPVVQRGLRRALAPFQQRIRHDRLSPRIRIGRDDKGHVHLQLDKQRGMRWLALATCLACWAYEDDCNRRGPESEDPLHLSMYRECLINQAASIAIRNDQSRGVSANERILLSAIEDGFLDAIVIWEVVAQRLPAVVLLLPDRLRSSILDYIDRYVIVSTRLALLERSN
ncbi:MAG: tetratricopeptide repeat protein [Myxococcota bacterium]